MVFIFLKSAMMHIKVLVFIVFHFNSFSETLQDDNTDHVSQELIVFHCNCTKMQENWRYSLNKVDECKVSPEILYTAPATFTLYQKSYRTDLRQHVLSRCMFSDTTLECSLIHHTCLSKIASFSTLLSHRKCVDWHRNPKKSNLHHLMKILMLPLSFM